MDYRELANELSRQLGPIIRHSNRHKLSGTAKGETFVMQLLLERSAVLSSDISTQMHVSTARVAAILNALENKGFITRTEDESDRRRVIVRITVAGQEEAQNQREFVLKHMEDMLRMLGERDASEFVRITGRICKSCRNDDRLDKNCK